MLYTAVNIKDNDNIFKYAIGYEPGAAKASGAVWYAPDYVGNIDLVNMFKDLDEDGIVRVESFWIDKKDYIKTYNDGSKAVRKYEQSPGMMFKTAKVYVYFPRFSVETYNANKHTRYALTLNTWVGSKRVVLGSYMISRDDTLAMAPTKIFGEEYYEYITIDIIDVFDMIYGDYWEGFRKSISPVAESSMGSLLNISLYPIEESDGVYNILSGYTGSQNSIRIGSGVNDGFLHMHLERFPTESCETLRCGVTYGDDGALKADDVMDRFMKDYNITYPITEAEEVDVEVEGEAVKATKTTTKSLAMRYNIVMRDDDDAYAIETKYMPYGSDDPAMQLFDNIGLWRDESNVAFEIDPKSNLVIEGEVQSGDVYGYAWKWWDRYDHDNKALVAQAIAMIIEETNVVTEYEGQELDRSSSLRKLLYMKSNTMPMTQEMFGYFCGPNYNLRAATKDAEIIDNMIIYNINAVNKTENVIRAIDATNDVKSNIIQPVFYKTRDLSNIVIHSDVTENICLNLDNYKSKVKMFYLKIEDVIFPEIGRTNAGVVFKVIGDKFATTLTSGTYYILNESSEVVTYGGYTEANQ